MSVRPRVVHILCDYGGFKKFPDGSKLNRKLELVREPNFDQWGQVVGQGHDFSPVEST